MTNGSFWSKSDACLKKLIFLFLLILFLSMLLTTPLEAAPGISIDFAAEETAEGGLGVLQILFMMMILALAPSILLMMTSFTRIVIVLSFLRNALGTAQSPPNQIIIGLALFLTLFIMNPVIEEINVQAYQPYQNGTLSQEEAFEAAGKPLKEFMLRQTQSKDLDLFMGMSGQVLSQTEGGMTQSMLVEELGFETIVPSFITSELKRAFTIGFMLFLPFLIVDMVVASTLMSMGMVMLPPAMIALPFKLMLFVLVDGWSLLIGTLAQGFR